MRSGPAADTWKMLCDKRSDFVLEAGTVWVLPEGLTSIVTECAQIYIRQDYVDFCDKFDDLPKENKRGLMMRGSPGIGALVTMHCCGAC